MSNRTPIAGGFLLMIAILAGFGGGFAAGQPSLGALAGIVIGSAAALILWLVDRRRRG